MLRPLPLLVVCLPLACADTGSGATSATDTTSVASSSSTDGSSTAASSTGVAETGAAASSTGAADSTGATEGDSTGGGPIQVQFETTLGAFVIELDPAAAPVTVDNFLTYEAGGFFDGTDGNGATIFHRVVPDFVIQGGGLTSDLTEKFTLPAIVNESGNGLANVRGAVAMARLDAPDTATSQFFVNLVDNDFLDTAPGYAVFGHVVAGMDVIDAMAEVATTTMAPYEDVPIEPIVVLSTTVL